MLPICKSPQLHRNLSISRSRKTARRKRLKRRTRINGEFLANKEFTPNNPKHLLPHSTFSLLSFTLLFKELYTTENETERGGSFHSLV
jgi:hypothetical protein